MRFYRALTQEKETQAQRNGRWQQSCLHISQGGEFGIKRNPQKWRKRKQEQLPCMSRGKPCRVEITALKVAEQSRTGKVLRKGGAGMGKPGGISEGEGRGSQQ